MSVHEARQAVLQAAIDLVALQIDAHAETRDPNYWDGIEVREDMLDRQIQEYLKVRGEEHALQDISWETRPDGNYGRWLCMCGKASAALRLTEEQIVERHTRHVQNIDDGVMEG